MDHKDEARNLTRIPQSCSVPYEVFPSERKTKSDLSKVFEPSDIFTCQEDITALSGRD